jgi:hypothetical protein
LLSLDSCVEELFAIAIGKGIGTITLLLICWLQTYTTDLDIDLAVAASCLLVQTILIQLFYSDSFLSSMLPQHFPSLHEFVIEHSTY